MSDTRFAAGHASAYVTDRVIALSDRGLVDDDVTAACIAADWDALVAAATSGSLDAVVVQDGRANDMVRVVVTGTASVVVTDRHGTRRFDGAAAWEPAIVEGAVEVSVLSSSAATVPELTFRVEDGTVPASVVWRRLGEPVHGPADPFDVLFGRTVPRTVEAAAVRTLDPDGLRPADLGVLVFSTGERVIVDADVVIGRRPRPVDACDARPRLVRLAGSAVSRQHAVIRTDRWGITIDDLGSVNGTVITMPGRRPVQLVPGSPVELAVGAVVDLGGEVSISLERAA